ncbi:hypothetical protein GNE10_10765 [Nostoc sp. 2RC]|nr:hypothetical protein [Nostoc sp. 2RC]
MQEFKYVTPNDIKRLLDGLSPEEREILIAEQIEKLSAESKARVLGLSESGLTVITGSFVSLNSDVAVNIQNSNGGFDAETLIKALVEYNREKRKKG